MLPVQQASIKMVRSFARKYSSVSRGTGGEPTLHAARTAQTGTQICTFKCCSCTGMRKSCISKRSHTGSHLFACR